jgi:hypothetical protein
VTPPELAQRLAALDWSACSLQHQLAVSVAILVLEASQAAALPDPLPSNVIDLSEIFRREAKLVVDSPL